MTNRMGMVSALACVATLTVAACSSSSSTGGSSGSTSGSSGSTSSGSSGSDAGAHPFLGKSCKSDADCGGDPKLACPRDPFPGNPDPPAKCSETCVLTGDCFHIDINWSCCKKDPWSTHICIGPDQHPDKSFCE